VHEPTAHTPYPARHANWKLAVLVVVGIALLCGFLQLGFWQLQRRVWKLDLIERVTQRLRATPLAVPAPEQWPHINAGEHEYLAVQLQGQWLNQHTVLTQASTLLGAGYWVLTPLQDAHGRLVYVNRGFVPSDQRTQWQSLTNQTPLPAPEIVTIEGLLRLNEPSGGFLRRNDPAQNRWFSRDVVAMAHTRQLPQAAPFFVDAGLPDLRTAQSADLPPNMQGPWPRPGLTVVKFANNHLVYAGTWFGLALLVAGAAVVVARYELRLRAAHRATTTHD
jgi:surfeit locus 1 family protein